MKEVRNLLYNLKAFDLVVVVFFLFLSLLNIIFSHRVDQWFLFVLLNIGVTIFVFSIAYLEANFKSKIFGIIHYWYAAPLILLTFKEIYYMVKPIRIYDFDWLFIEIDRAMFGTDPTRFLSQFSFPLLTEILQIVYGMFYLLPIFLGLALLKKKRYVALDFVVFSVVYGFFLSYLGYFSLPGIGPRFTLHNFETINEQLPGLFLTNYLRELVNTGESIPSGTINPAEIVQRDIFPSGHTMITLIVIFLSIRLKSRSRYYLVPIGTLLIFSTVYLWYHYVIDLIGGLIFMIFSVWSGKLIFNWWRRKIGQPEFEYGEY